MRRVCLALLLLLPLMLLPALGAEVSFSQADELLEAAEDYGVDPQASLETGVQGILQAGLDQLGEMLRRSLGTGIKLLAVALVLCEAKCKLWLWCQGHFTGHQFLNTE